MYLFNTRFYFYRLGDWRLQSYNIWFLYFIAFLCIFLTRTIPQLLHNIEIFETGTVAGMLHADMSGFMGAVFWL